MINSYDFLSYQDAIGYNWKEYNFESQNYTVNTDLNYIIKDVSNRYFKLHFIDFYNEFRRSFPRFRTPLSKFEFDRFVHINFL